MKVLKSLFVLWISILLVSCTESPEFSEKTMDSIEESVEFIDAFYVKNKRYPDPEFYDWVSEKAFHDRNFISVYGIKIAPESRKGYLIRVWDSEVTFLYDPASETFELED